MASFTNHRLIEKTFARIMTLTPEGSLPGIDYFYRDVYRLDISVGGVPCLSCSKVLIDEISEEVRKEEDPAVRSSKALFKSIFQKYNIDSSKQPYYENFIKLFLNQLYIGIPTMFYSCLLIEKGLSNTELTFDVDINLNSNNLYLTTFYSFKQADNENDIILKGKTTFKIEIRSFNKGNLGFVAEFGLVDSTIECSNKYKHILDTRNFLEKFVDFITSIIKKTTASFLNQNPSLKSKPIFFVSKDGESLDDKLINPPKKLLKEMTR